MTMCFKTPSVPKVTPTVTPTPPPPPPPEAEPVAAPTIGKKRTKGYVPTSGRNALRIDLNVPGSGSGLNVPNG